MQTISSLNITSDEAFELDSILTSRGYKAAVAHVRQHLHMPTWLAQQLVDARDALRRDRSDASVFSPTDMLGTRTELQLASTLLALVGLGLLVVGGMQWYWQHEIVDCGIEVEGVVASFYSTSSGASPVFEYNWNGERLTYRSHLASQPAAYSLGQPATLYVDPEFPSQAVVDDFLHRWLFITVCGSLGAGLIVVGGILGLIGRPTIL